jgi:hypothetical protein
MHPAYEGLAALPYYDEFDLSTVDVLLISQYVISLSVSPMTARQDESLGSRSSVLPNTGVCKLVSSPSAWHGSVHVLRQLIYTDESNDIILHLLCTLVVNRFADSSLILIVCHSSEPAFANMMPLAVFTSTMPHHYPTCLPKPTFEDESS